MKWSAALLLGVMLLGSNVADADETLRRAQESVVKLYGVGGVRGLEGYQTGVFVDDEAAVLTIESPLLDAEPIVGIDAWGDRYELRLIGADAATGLALLGPASARQPPAAIDLSAGTQPASAQRLWCLTNLFAIAEGEEPVTVQSARLAGRGRMPAPLGPIANASRFAVGAPSPGSPVLILDAVTSNPGAGGGLLIDAGGSPVGVLGAEVRSAATGAWMNYATPADEAAAAIARILEGAPGAAGTAADVGLNSRATLERLGVRLIPVVNARTPAYVEAIESASPAAAAGVRADDLIVAVDSATAGTVQAAQVLVGDAVTRRSEVELTILRDGRIATVVLREDAP